MAAGELKWRKVDLQDYFIDFNSILGHVTEHSVAYAVCYVRSEAAQRGLQEYWWEATMSRKYI